MGEWERRGSGGRVRGWGKGREKGRGRKKGRGKGMEDRGRGRGKEGGWGKGMGNEGCGKGKWDGDWEGGLGTGPRFETQVDGRVSRMGGFRVEGLSLYLNGCEQ